MPVTSWPCSDGSCGRHRRVHAARHRCQDAHQLATPAGRHTARQRRVARAFDNGGDRLDQGVDIGLRGGVAEREPQRGAGRHLRRAHREPDVGGLRHPGVARRARRALDAARVQQHQQRVALAPGELEVRVGGQPVLRAALRVAVVDRVGHLAADTLDQGVAKGGQSLSLLAAGVRPRSGRPRRSRRWRAGRWSRTGCRAPGRRRAAGRSAAAHGVRRARRRRTGRRSCDR